MGTSNALQQTQPNSYSLRKNRGWKEKTQLPLLKKWSTYLGYKGVSLSHTYTLIYLTSAPLLTPIVQDEFKLNVKGKMMDVDKKEGQQCHTPPPPPR